MAGPRGVPASVPGGWTRPKPPWCREIVVLFDIVRAVIAGGAQVFRETVNPGTQRLFPAEMLRSHGTGKDACDQTRPNGRTDAGRSESVRVSDAFCRQAIQIRRDGVRIAITADYRTEVLGGNPQDIGLAGRGVRSLQSRSGSP